MLFSIWRLWKPGYCLVPPKHTFQVDDPTINGVSTFFGCSTMARLVEIPIRYGLFSGDWESFSYEVNWVYKIDFAEPNTLCRKLTWLACFARIAFCCLDPQRLPTSGQIIVFHQPKFPWNKGISLHFLGWGRVRSLVISGNLLVFRWSFDWEPRDVGAQ